MVELLEKYLAMAVSMIILVSFVGPILGEGGLLVADCCNTVLVKLLIDEIDFGVSEAFRTGRSYESVVRVPSELVIKADGCQLVISFSVFNRRFVVFRNYHKPIQLHSPTTAGNHLLSITNTGESILIIFQVF